MKFSRFSKFLCSCALATSLSTFALSAAQAAPIQISFGASISQISPSLASGFSLGQVINGSYRFDSSTPDSAGAATTGLYFNAGTFFAAQTGGLNFAASNVDIDISNLPAVDIYRVVGSVGANPSGSTISGYILNSIVLSLTDNVSATALTSDLLPLVAPTLSSFNVALLTLGFVQPTTGNAASVQANLTSLVNQPIQPIQPNAVPAPASAMLLLCCLPMLLSFNRRPR